MFRERGGGRERGRERGSGASEQGPLVGRKNGVPTLDPRPASWGRGVLRPIFFFVCFTHLLDGVVSGLCRDDELHELHLLAPPKVAHGGAGLPPSPLPPRRTPISGALGPSASPLTMKPSRNSEKSSISELFANTSSCTRAAGRRALFPRTQTWRYLGRLAKSGAQAAGGSRRRGPKNREFSPPHARRRTGPA